MHLPEELLDEIFSHLSPLDSRVLQNCSLVSKSWLQPSQRLLFAIIIIGPATYRSWLDNISPTNTGLLRHVRLLACRFGGGGTADSRWGVHTLQDYLPSFFQLQQLIFERMSIETAICEHLQWFSAFQHALSSLSLVRVSITWSAFVALVGYFPNLRDLVIFETSFQVDDQPIPPLPHALRGKLSVSFGRAMEFPIDRFVGLKLEYEELEMYGAYEACLVAAVEQSLKHLTIGPSSFESTSSLSRCPELRQLWTSRAFPQEGERILISSITSTNLRKLVFPQFWPDFLKNTCWVPFDDMICRLVDRLQASGYKHILELEFRACFEVLGEEVHVEDFLPKFQEKGLVRIVDFLSGRFLEWPRK
ncbi:hypothetical protein BDM02DRAFT_2349858 [Thelephora ganbajun]|uniref:Uncharacterized protein n=1 Tax=Thelephora ganbajun TaxID=370292 RepID=A0ACB6ZEU7_THEGA|nr:hypothetical protein BDM02DRAFT_2349858 [Thelephora ganbajun]